MIPIPPDIDLELAKIWLAGQDLRECTLNRLSRCFSRLSMRWKRSVLNAGIKYLPVEST